MGDLGESRRFYEALAAQAGFRLRADTPDRAQFAGRTGSFSLVAGAPTEHLHMAFAVERDPQLLRDPDGNVVELVGPGQRSE